MRLAVLCEAPSEIWGISRGSKVAGSLHDEVMTDEPGRRGRPTALEAVGLAAGAATAFPATWWMLGRIDQSGAWITDPDYAVQPPQIDRGLAHVIGAGSTALAAAALAVVVVFLARGRWASCVAGIVLPLMAGFAYAGAVGHVATAPGIGANIGFGLMVFAALPIGVLLLVVMAFSLRAWSRQGSQWIGSDSNGRPQRHEVSSDGF